MFSKDTLRRPWVGTDCCIVSGILWLLSAPGHVHRAHHPSVLSALEVHGACRGDTEQGHLNSVGWDLRTVSKRSQSPSLKEWGLPDRGGTREHEQLKCPV